ncbi:MAG TPA: glycosyltransferase family 2 protein [Candidatus Saccharimonadales bacterium]|nr:glycosyltransferase family 2 protein [Candidatus Saccharimonadales bacterium]
MKKSLIYLIVPNWNGKNRLSSCLDSLLSQNQSAQVLVVDNGSTDGSVEFVKQKYPGVQLISLPQNTGFSGGVNAGIKKALEVGADYIGLFNNDAVADKNWLSELVKVLDNQAEVGIVTCKLMRDDRQHFDSTGDQYSIYGMPFPRARNVLDEGQFDKPEPVFSASGGASLYRAKLFTQVGLFDQKFFAYYEDVDISFRARSAGWQIYYQPSALAYHEVSATSSGLGSFTRYHATKNFYLLYLKNMPGWLFWKYLPNFGFQTLRLAASSLIKGGSWAFIRGTLRAIVYLPAIFTDRHKVQSFRKVSPASIDALLYKQRPPKIPSLP